jgi:uncharacterized membrane protein YozB (DUF420 family)
MDMQSLASAISKRLLVSLAIFAAGFVLVCVLVPVPSGDWAIAMIGALPAVVPIFIVVSVIWFVAGRVRNRRQTASEIKRRTSQ